MSATTSHPPRHDPDMTVKWTEPIVTWFWHIWHLLRSIAVLTKRRPPLPQSASHPELENGLFTFGASTFPRGTPSGKAKGVDKHASGTHNDPLNIMDFRFTFETKVNDGPGDSSQGSLVPDSASSTRLNIKSLRRQKRTRESTERRRQRRVGRVPDFTPPPEIHIEDWSDQVATSTSQVLPSWQLPEFHRLSSLSTDPVPFVIITPSTPSVEDAGVLEDLHMIVPLSPTNKVPPLHTLAMHQTTPQCDQIAQVLAPDGSDESTPSLENDHSHQTDNADFTFTESLKAAAFGKSATEPEHVVLPNLKPESPPMTEIPSPAPLHTIPPLPPTDAIDESFQPILNSTPRHTGSQAEATQDSMFDDGPALNLEFSFPEQVNHKPTGDMPYCDIFDLDMYADLRASMAAFGIYSANDHHGTDLPPLPTPVDTPSSDLPLPVLARFSFAAPLNLAMPTGSNDALSVPLEVPQAASESGVNRTSRSSGIYTLSGHFKFPPTRPPLAPLPEAPDSPEIPLAVLRRSLTRVSDDVLPTKSKDETPSPPPVTPRLLYSSGSHLSIGSEIKRYRDHYRHSAYSRSPPLRAQPVFTPSSPGSFGSTESTIFPRRNTFATPIVNSPSPEIVAANRSLPEARSARRSLVKAARTKRFSAPLDPEAAEGVHASPRRTSIFRVPSPREPLAELNDLPNGQNVPSSPSPREGDAAKGQRKSSPSISSLISAKGSKRKNQAPWKATRKNAENVGSDAPGASKSIRSASVVRRLANARKGGGSTKVAGSSGVAGGVKDEPTGGRTLNLLKEVNRQQERRKAGVVEEPDETMTSTGHVGETTLSSLTRGVLGLVTPRMNHDRILKHRGDTSGERIVTGRKRLFAKL